MAKISKEYKRKTAVRRTTQELKRFIDGAARLKDSYIEKAKQARAKNAYALYQIARSGLKTTMMQLAKAEEMLSNMELIAQYADFAKLSSGFVAGMGSVSKELSKAAASMNFEKAEKLFNKAMQKADFASDKMGDFLNNSSDTFVSSASLSDMLDSEIDKLVGGEIVSEESEIDRRLANLRESVEPIQPMAKPVAKKAVTESVSEVQSSVEEQEKPKAVALPQAKPIEKPAVAEQSNAFEPKTLSEFIGQSKTVRALKDAIAEAKMDGKKGIAGKGGVLFLGGKGLGKTTLMQLTANELGVKCEFFDASSMKNDVSSRRSFDLFLERIAKEGTSVVIAVDEIHALPMDIQSRLLTLLQSRVYSNLVNGEAVNLPMPEFTFIAATTDEHGILETVYDRFNKGLICELEDYTVQELKYIIDGKAAHFGLRISDEAKSQIVPRGRSSLREIESYIIKLRQKAKLSGKTEIDENMTSELFSELGVDVNGLYAKDIEILEALESAPNYSLSEENLVSKVNLKLENYQKFRKPFLIRSGYIASSSKGQNITEKSILLLNGRR
ncbi:MAG: AAA family ATPase [Firmicutes bacterium]|nr:AAA family ATPase [Bacillota bacterium]